MAKFRATTTLGYAHGKEMIPALAVFDPAALEIGEAIITAALKEKLIQPVAESEAITFGPAPEEAEKPKKPVLKKLDELLPLIEAAETLEALDALAEGETRKTAVDAIEKKRQALKTPSE